jgi:hypothetical protein
LGQERRFGRSLTMSAASRPGDKCWGWRMGVNGFHRAIGVKLLIFLFGGVPDSACNETASEQERGELLVTVGQIRRNVL